MFLLPLPVPSSPVSSFTTVVLSGCFLGPTILLVPHVCLGFRTSRCFGTIDIPGHSRVSHLYPFLTRLVQVAKAILLSPFPFCSSLLLLFFLRASGQKILFVSSSPICFRVCSPCCLKLLSVLLCMYLLLFIYLGTFGRTVLLVFHLFACLPPLFSPGSILSFLPNHLHSSLRLLGKEWVSWPLVFRFTFLLCPGLLACISIAVLVTECFGAKPIKPIIRYLLNLSSVTLPSVSTTCYPTCLPTWFPCPLSTTVLLSRSPALAGIRPERKGFLLIPFFITYLFL